MVDMPVEQLLQYQGRNPRPADFDEYWNRALEEQRATDPQAKLEPAEFQCSYAECFHLTFTGVKGARIYAKFLRPKNVTKPGPALLCFHGYGAASGAWTEYLRYVAAGFCVAAMDCRGQGGLSEDMGGIIGDTKLGHIIRGLDGQPEDLLYRQIFLDTAQLFRVVTDMPEVDPARVGAVGTSQGGALTLACAALNPTLNRAFASLPFLCDYKRVWEMGLAKLAYGELTHYFRYFDPRHEREDAVFTRLGYVDVQHLAPRIRAKFVLNVGLSDTTCPPSTQFAAYNKITSDKQLWLYPDFVHEFIKDVADMDFQFFCQM